MLKLYFAPGSSSMAPHIAMHEIGVPFESHALQFGTPEIKSAAYLAVNPEGKVPTLNIDGRRLSEVAGILFYLARRHPEAGLLPPPTQAEAEAQVVSWMSFVASTLHPARGRGPEHATAMYTLADQRLGRDAWCVASHGYSIADIHLFRLFWRLSGSLKPPAGTFPNLEAHYARMMARPAVQRTIEIETAIGYRLP